MQNIVQAEFFHVGGKGMQPLSDLLAECYERIADGLELALAGEDASTRIKTVVRFFDESNILTNMTLKIEELSRQERILINGSSKARGLRRWWLDFQSRRVFGKSIKLQEKIQIRATVQLQKAIRASHEIAVERSDYSFRYLRRNEAHDLNTSVQKAKGMMLFIFEPGSLLADKNIMIAHMI